MLAVNKQQQSRQGLACERNKDMQVHVHRRVCVCVCIYKTKAFVCACINDGGRFVSKFSKIFSMHTKAKVNNKNEHKQANSAESGNELIRGRRTKCLMKEIEASRLQGLTMATTTQWHSEEASHYDLCESRQLAYALILRNFSLSQAISPPRSPLHIHIPL